MKSTAIILGLLSPSFIFLTVNNSYATVCSELTQAKYLNGLEGIPTGKRETTDMRAWIQNLQHAKRDLLDALNPEHWEAAGIENRTFGTLISDPTKLRGQVIVGIEQNMTATGGRTVIFGGIVHHVYDLHPDFDERPFFHAVLETRSGFQEIKLSGAYAVHKLRNAPSGSSE